GKVVESSVRGQFVGVEEVVPGRLEILRRAFVRAVHGGRVGSAEFEEVPDLHFRRRALQFWLDTGKNLSSLLKIATKAVGSCDLSLKKKPFLLACGIARGNEPLLAQFGFAVIPKRIDIQSHGGRFQS